MSGNRISGGTPDPAANAVLQVGISVGLATGTTQVGNELTGLDRGIEAVGAEWHGNTRDVSGNLFRNVREGLYFYQSIIGVSMQPGRLTIRCNTFENPGNLTGAVGLRIAANAEFPTTLGTVFNPNGNRFGTAGVPVVVPIVNNSGSFQYFYYGSSTQEILPVNPPGYVKILSGGNLASACANYANGINARSALPQTATVGLEALREAQDSLRLSAIPPQRRSALLTTLVSATGQLADYAGLESYLKTLPDPTGPVHAALAAWLLWTYHTTPQPAEAARVGAELLRHHAADAEVRRLVQLVEALSHLRALPQSQRPASADLLSLQEVATSGTASARRACSTLRRYVPACPCRLVEEGTMALAKPLTAAFVATGSLHGTSLGAPYPNPATNELRVPYMLNAPGATARLEIRDVVGRTVYQCSLATGSGEARVPVGALAEGLYTCALVVNGQVRAARRVAVVQ